MDNFSELASANSKRKNGKQDVGLSEESMKHVLCSMWYDRYDRYEDLSYGRNGLNLNMSNLVPVLPCLFSMFAFASWPTSLNWSFILLALLEVHIY